MQLSGTIKIKLDISIEAIRPAIEAYTKAFNPVCRTGWNDSDSNGVSLHHKTYRELKKYLPSQLVISARMKATEALKAVKKRIGKKQKLRAQKADRLLFVTMTEVIMFGLIAAKFLF